MAVTPSYTGSDDYVLTPFPIVFGRVHGIQVSPRAGGLSLNFVADKPGKLGLILGVAGRLRSERSSNIQDDVVKSLGELDRAVELGPVVGISKSQALNPYDSLSAQVVFGWDVAGAHKGLVIEPSVQYFTPLSRAIIASLSFSAEYQQAKVQDYYFRVTPAQSLATGGVLPTYEPDGGGFTKAGTTLLVAYDLDGDLTNKGFGVFGVLGYTRVLGDAKNSPYTSVRGSADQFLAGAGIGYVF